MTPPSTKEVDMDAVVDCSFKEVIQVIIPTSKAYMAQSIRDAINARLDAQGRPLIVQSDITFTNAPSAGIRFQYSVELEVKSMLGHLNHRQAIENTYYTDDVEVFLGERDRYVQSARAHPHPRSRQAFHRGLIQHHYLGANTMPSTYQVRIMAVVPLEVGEYLKEIYGLDQPSLEDFPQAPSDFEMADIKMAKRLTDHMHGCYAGWTVCNRGKHLDDYTLTPEHGGDVQFEAGDVDMVINAYFNSRDIDDLSEALSWLGSWVCGSPDELEVGESVPYAAAAFEEYGSDWRIFHIERDAPSAAMSVHTMEDSVSLADHDFEEVVRTFNESSLGDGNYITVGLTCGVTVNAKVGAYTGGIVREINALHHARGLPSIPESAVSANLRRMDSSLTEYRPNFELTVECPELDLDFEFEEKRPFFTADLATFVSWYAGVLCHAEAAFMSRLVDVALQGGDTEIIEDVKNAFRKKLKALDVPYQVIV